MSDSVVKCDSLALLATEALADDRSATPGPWAIDGDTDHRGEYRVDGITSPDGFVVICDSGVYPPDEPTARFIAAARTREPLLAAGVLQLLEEQRKLTLLWQALGDNTDEVEDLTRDRDEYKAQHDNALASWAVDRKNLEDAAHRSRCDLLDAQVKCADLTRQLAEARAEIERLKWAALNQCDDTTLALQKLKLENYDLRRWADAPITSVEIYKGEAHRARKERDEARAALVEACRVLELRADPLWPDYDEEIARIVELKAKGGV